MPHTEHQPRISWAAVEQSVPGVIPALRAMSKAVADTGIDAALIELVKLRASQLNSCAFCLQHHLQQARQLGVPALKLDLLAAWREAGIFSAREGAALAWAEALTLMAGQPVSDALYQDLQTQFSTAEIAQLTAAIANINAWNRIAGALQFALPVTKG